MKPTANVEWLETGKLVVVYRPTSRREGDTWSKKLLFQFAGPFRITKVYRGAVHMNNLDGTPADSHNINNVYPYNALQDDVMEQFDRKWFSTADFEEAHTPSLIGKMICVDLTDSNGSDFRIAKVVDKVPGKGATFMIHYYTTNSKHKSMSLRPYYPNWFVPRPNGDGDVEKCTLNPGEDAIANTAEFEMKELLFQPFDLTKHHVPHSIIEKLLQLNMPGG